MGEIISMELREYWPVLSLEERADVAAYYGTDTLMYCRDRWAIRHYWVHRESGEVQRARCNRWECAYCGPRKVNVWRSLVKLAEPVLFLTLTKAGKTVEQARRALTTFMQALRRGRKGRGKSRKGARPAYPVEYFAVLERHADFERNGFHWHILIKGVEQIPYKEVIQPLWMSATHYRPATEEQEGQGAMIGHIERIRNGKAIGYVTKYLMKALAVGERGKKEVKRERMVLVQGEDGMFRQQKEVVSEQVTSKAHRICYSRQFFPDQVKQLRMRLFAGVEYEETGEEEQGEPGEQERFVLREMSFEEWEEEQRPSWVLKEREIEGYVDVEEYKRQRFAEAAQELEEADQQDQETYQRRKRRVLAQISKEVRDLVAEVYRRLERRILLEALEENPPMSRRVISMWMYQRKCLRLAS